MDLELEKKEGEAKELQPEAVRSFLNFGNPARPSYCRFSIANCRLRFRDPVGNGFENRQCR